MCFVPFVVGSKRCRFSATRPLQNARHVRSPVEHPRHPWSVSDPVQRFNDLTAAKQFVFIRVYSWLTFADGCG